MAQTIAHEGIIPCSVFHFHEDGLIFRFHELSHTMATRLVEEKVPLNIVQGILGHSSIETTRKYLHKNEEIEREAIESMSNHLSMESLLDTPQLNGAKKRGKFAGVILPDFSDKEKGSGQ